MARTYKRDKNGRFAGGGGSSKKPAKKTQQRGTNRIRRDNAGKIQGIGGTGATGRGGRLRTAKGNKRATVTMQAKGVTPRGAIKGKVRRDPGAMAKAGKAKTKPTPKVDTNSFGAMKRRVDRTRFRDGGLNFDTSDRPSGRWGGARKDLTAGINRKRAFGIYRSQASRPLRELSAQMVRAPFGRFSTVKNPAPAKAFPSQAPGRTKAAEVKVRGYRAAAKATKGSTRKRRR